jgi:MFS family permease
MSFPAMFSVLWGQPFLVAQGFTRNQASGVLTLSVLMAIIGSPLVGAGVARRPAARVPFALGVSFTIVVGWTALVLGFGGRPPHALLVAAVVVAALGGPASAIGFSLARDYNPAETVGTASGLVNVGGFTATIVASLAVGRVLDFVGMEGVGAYRLAFGAAIAVIGFGAVQALIWYRRLRADVLAAQSRGEPVPVPATRHRWDIATA